MREAGMREKGRRPGVCVWLFSGVLRGSFALFFAGGRVARMIYWYTVQQRARRIT